MKKLAGDSPLRVIVVAFTVIFFVALFIWQIDAYLHAGQDSQLQSELSVMSSVIESDSIDAAGNMRYAYLHNTNDVSEVFTFTNQDRKNFKPKKALVSLFLKNGISPKNPTPDSCFIFSYFPPALAASEIDSITSAEPMYYLAGWSQHQSKPIVTGSPLLVRWAETQLREDDFYCKANELLPNKTAVNRHGEKLNLLGYDFQFSDLYYSKVTQ